MKKIWISYCTEHEFGTRDDGYMVSDDLEAMNAKIKENQVTGNREQYWTYSTPAEVWCSKKTYEKVMEKKTDSNVAFYGNYAKLKLFKRI